MLVKTLKKLQELDITLEILAETGIGKVVNSFRKHDAAGEVAKTLVHRWKKLVQNPSITQQRPPSPKDPSKTKIQQMDQEERSRASQNTVCSERKPKNEKSGSEHKPSKNVDGKHKVKPIANKLKDCINNKKDGAKKESDVGLASQISITDGKLFQPKEKSTSNAHTERKDEGKHKVSDVTNKHRPKMSTNGKRTTLKERDLSEEKRGKKDEKTKEKAVEMDKNLESDDFETPSMSFEEYLRYDLEAPKRKKRLCESKNLKRIKVEQKQDVKMRDSSTKSGKSITEASATVVSKRSVMDLLNVPLPIISPECEDPSQYQYFTEKKVEEKAAEVREEAPVFTGQRLNKKMQVYSGAKVVYLPSMMTLYQQCIRTLQNNIDSLYEIGGVPFEILEPVLERCTPEQLLRIEECNPVYVGVTDHLWERHCLRDFRNAQLEDYESWKEMYLRLFEQRERKLQELTKSIVSAQSGKPKGRQVKMAFIHSAAKPPRNVRIQQELHGTAGPVVPHAAEKLSGRITENRSKPGFTEPPKPFNTASGASQPQDPRRIRRVAPMMAKSLKAFKKLGRR
ncbi:elongin A, like isoform X3 [Ictalurus punctatus]|uniref:Elongin A, like isoform X3 n=1 Tax=Ictalurus punctatus TaxID=7998 RepID=A0A2D0QS90_ICTPU|nr:elongin A, like isoform X3 [Ictalurus punctatus]